MSISTSLHPNAAVLPWYKHRWPWLLMLGPGIVVIAGIYTGWLAYSRQDALVVGDYYKQGKAINQSLKRDRIAAQMGLQLTLRYDAAAGTLIGGLQADQPMAENGFVLRLIHPTLPEKDMNFVIKPDADGRFLVPLALLELGHWQVVVEGSDGRWRLGGVWNWPKDRSISVHADQRLAEIEP